MQDSYGKSFSPYLKFNALITKTTQSLINSNFQCIEAFTKIGLDNFCAGVNSRTLEDFVAFTKKQPEVLQKTSQLFIKNSQSYAELANQAFDDAQGLLSGHLKDMKVITPAELIPKYDLGKSTVIRKSKKDSLNKEVTKAKANAKARVKTSSIKVESKKKAISSKNTRANNQQAKPTKKVVATAKVKPIAKNLNTSPVKNTVKPKPKPVTKAINTKVSKSSSTTVSAKVTPLKSKPKAEAKKVDSPNWDKPTSKTKTIEKAENKEAHLLSSAAKPVTKTRLQKKVKK